MPFKECKKHTKLFLTMYGAEPMITSYFPQSAICFWAFPALAWFYLTDTTLSPVLQNSLQEACPLQPKSKIPSVLNISPQGPPPPPTKKNPGTNKAITQSQYIKSFIFLHTINEQLKFKIKNMIAFTLQSPNEILRYKANKLCTRSTWDKN